MKRALRLRAAADFTRVRNEGRIVRHPTLWLALRNNSLAHNRYGFVVNKTLGAAACRNRCKRRLRALSHQLHDDLVQGHDLVFIARVGLPSQPFSEMRRIVIGLLARARVMVGRATC